ncbi:MAG: CAP domain-containing protein [Bacteroidia bacterium]
MRSFFFLFICSTLKLIAQQDPYYFQWDPKVLEMANTANDVDYLSSQEKKLIYYTNLVRMNPQLFIKTYMQSYLKQYNIPKNSWYWKMVKEMKDLPPTTPLYPDKMLFDVAKKHAKDMGLSGKKGHRNTKGEFYQDRIAYLKKEFVLVKENIQYGYWDPLAILCDLLIDEDVKTGIHRRLILNPDLKYIAVSIQAHKKFEYNAVIEYAGMRVEKIDPSGNLEQ